MIYKILYDCGKKQDGGFLRAILTIGLNRSLTMFSPIVLAESQLERGLVQRDLGAQLLFISMNPSEICKGLTEFLKITSVGKLLS